MSSQGADPVAASVVLAVPVSFNLTTTFTTPVTAPTYVTYITLSLTTLRPSSYLKLEFTSTWRHTGAFLGNVAVNFRFRIDGVLIVGGTTDNSVRSQIHEVSRVYREVVSAGLHTVIVEITKFSGGANVLLIDPVAVPDLDHGALHLSEEF